MVDSLGLKFVCRDHNTSCDHAIIRVWSRRHHRLNYAYNSSGRDHNIFVITRKKFLNVITAWSHAVITPVITPLFSLGRAWSFWHNRAWSFHKKTKIKGSRDEKKTKVSHLPCQRGAPQMPPDYDPLNTKWKNSCVESWSLCPDIKGWKSTPQWPGLTQE